MNKNEINELLNHYVVHNIQEIKEINSSKEFDYRLNLIIDKKYILRINEIGMITEERLDSIARLVERYINIGIKTPRLIKSLDGKYIINYNNYVCYLTEYLDYNTLDSIENEIIRNKINDEVLASVGRFAKKYSNIDLININSMWSLIDLAPLDIEKDEKQENLNVLIDKLNSIGELKLVNDIIRFNNQKREKIKNIYKKLPRCVIQGDLNDTNILIENDHFIGLIDFNMSGTEVNINNFCCETNETLDEDNFNFLSARELYNKWILKQKIKMNIILNEYELNDEERLVIEDYRSICLLSQYPNVCLYNYYLDIDKNKIKEILKLILER